MQEFSIAFGRVTRSVFVANPELKSQMADLLARAYQNLRGTPITTADAQWVSSLHGAATQLCIDGRVADLSVRALVQLFENLILISEEHLKESRRHAAMACNVFYLKETALDSLNAEGEIAALSAAPSTVLGHNVAHSGRVQVVRPGDPLNQA